MFLSKERFATTGVGFSKKEIALHKGISDLKYYLIIMYLRIHIEGGGLVRTSLLDISTECGYSSTSARRQTFYDDWRSVLSDIVATKGTTCNKDISNVTPTEQFEIQFNDEDNPFYTDDSFVFIMKKEFDAIINSDVKNKSVLIGVYLYIKQFIIDTPLSPGMAYPTKQQIKNGIGLSSTTTVKSAIDTLVELQLLHMYSDFYIEDSVVAGTYIPASNIYSLQPLKIESCIQTLESKYGKPVYTKDTVPGIIKFLNNNQNTKQN